MKKILILGGTQFIGRNLVERLEKVGGYEITLFNRQQTHPHLFPGIRKLKGDRETKDIHQIANEHWDFVIDLSCYYPDSVASVLQHLNGDLEKYIFISTCSVYDNTDNHKPLRDEQAQILSCTTSQGTNRSPETYGNRKAECERILQNSELNHVILRPALVYGAYDPTGRFYYWLYQVRHNDTLLLPDNGERTFSITYVGDLVETITQALTSTAQNNVYNMITLPRTSIRQITDCARELLDKNPEYVNAAPSFLHENNISQWTDMPLWIDNDYFTYNNQKLLKDFDIGLTSLKEGVTETIDYFNKAVWPEPIYGIKEKTRQELIKKIKTK